MSASTIQFPSRKADRSNEAATQHKHSTASSVSVSSVSPTASSPSSSSSSVWCDCSADEVSLRLFDLDPCYGPCTGLTRKERWTRAQQLHKNPPQHVLEILERHEQAGTMRRVTEAEEEEKQHKTKKLNQNQKKEELFKNTVSEVSIFNIPSQRRLEVD